MDQIDRLISAFRTAGNADDPEQALRNYLLAVEVWELEDVTAAVNAFIAGNVPGVHRGFMPTSAELGGECRRQLGLRMESTHRERMRRPQLPPPDIEKSPESRARVKAQVAQLISKLADDHRTEDAAAAKRKADMQKRHDERFAPDPSSGATLQRLGFDVGDHDGEVDAA